MEGMYDEFCAEEVWCDDVAGAFLVEFDGFLWVVCRDDGSNIFIFPLNIIKKDF